MASAAILLVAVTVWQQRAGDPTAGRAAAQAIGPGTPVGVDRPAPDFEGASVWGDGTLSLRRYDGVVVVNFWSSTCFACRFEVPQLDDLWRAYEGEGVQFLGVDYMDGRNAAIYSARTLGMSYPSVFDPSGKIGRAFGIFGLPTTYIIAPDDRIRYIVYGRIRRASFRIALESMLKPTVAGADAR